MTGAASAQGTAPGELQSLLEPTATPPGFTLPAGHPFVVPSGFFWSATTQPTNSTVAFEMRFDEGSAVDSGGNYFYYEKLVYLLHRWCVRSPQGIEVR